MSSTPTSRSLDENGAGPRCGQHADANNEGQCASAAGCFVNKHYEGLADLPYDLYDDSGQMLDRDDPNTVLTMKWEARESDDDDEWGYCYTVGSNGERRCTYDSDMTWADVRGFRTSEHGDIVLPNNLALMHMNPRRLTVKAVKNDFVYEPQVIRGSSSFYVVPWKCKHDFCANGEDWANEDLTLQTAKLTEAILKEPSNAFLTDDFRNILTASFRVLNPYAAFLYGVDINEPGLFTDPMNRDEWTLIHDIKGPGNLVDGIDPRFRSLHLEDSVPAGWLTTPTFLRRYPTTETNLHRMRSKEVYEKFLSIDLMALVNFTVDPNQPLPDNATMDGFSFVTRPRIL